jgi:hypothetical protein
MNENVVTIESQLEIFIKNKNQCFFYTQIFQKQADIFSDRNKALNVFTLILSGISGAGITSSNLYKAVSTDITNVLLTLFGVFSIVSSVLDSIQLYLNYAKLAIDNKTASRDFEKLANHMERILAQNSKEYKNDKEYNEDTDISLLYEFANNEFDLLNLSKPDIFIELINSPQFQIKEMENGNNSSSNDSPEMELSDQDIIVVSPVNKENAEYNYLMTRYQHNNKNNC